MKKLIAILMVLAIVVGAAFAATQENHKITVHAAIEETVPAFQLYYSNDIKTNDSAAKYADDSGSARTANIDEVPAATKKLDLETGDSITFTVKLLNRAKIVKVYSVEFKGGQFATTTNTSSTPVDPTITTDTTSFANEAGVKVTGSGNKNVTVTFNGTRCEAVDLFDVTYTYDAHPEFDPVEDLTSDVIMTVSTT